MSEDSKFRKDVADPEADFKKLDEIFEVNTTTGEIVKTEDIKAEVVEMRKELKEIEESLPDVDGIILDNINRANRFLDVIEAQIMAGNLKASMIESCATLINAVTAAATSITGISYNNEMLDIKRDELRIREKKVTIDAMKANNPSHVEGDVHITQNTITMTREELLKELSKND